jgi:hypothetical protein
VLQPKFPFKSSSAFIPVHLLDRRPPRSALRLSDTLIIARTCMRKCLSLKIRNVKYVERERACVRVHFRHCFRAEQVDIGKTGDAAHVLADSHTPPDPHQQHHQLKTHSRRPSTISRRNPEGVFPFFLLFTSLRFESDQSYLLFVTVALSGTCR